MASSTADEPEFASPSPPGAGGSPGRACCASAFQTPPGQRMTREDDVIKQWLQTKSLRDLEKELEAAEQALASEEAEEEAKAEAEAEEEEEEEE